MKGNLRDRFHESKIPKDVDFVVVGSGMGGLCCAATLCRVGYRVVVLEQHEVAGGSTHEFDLKSGGPFDSGLHYTVPWSDPILRIVCGQLWKPVVRFERMGDSDGAFDHVVIGGEGNEVRLKMKAKEGHLKDLYEMFGHEREALDRYMRMSDEVLKDTPLFFVMKCMPQWMQRVWFKFVLGRFVRNAGRTTQEVLQGLTDDKVLASVLSSMWIDTTTPPTSCSFFLGASVFRGLPIETGVYPEGGSSELARALVRVIERHGGRVLCRADVEEIELEDGRASAVRLRSGHRVAARRGIVSAVGYKLTFGSLVKEDVGVPVDLPGVGQSPSFVMANITVRGSAASLGLQCHNTVFTPADAHGDIFPALDAFFADPLHGGVDPPCMITFPSVKDPAFARRRPDLTTCQVLIPARMSWFPSRAAYDDVKSIWASRVLAALRRFYPQLLPHILELDISTPHSIERYIRAPLGAAVGLDVTPQRFTNFDTVRLLDTVTPVPNLFLTGQDTLLCGVALAQASGFISALRIMGFFNTLYLFLQTLRSSGLPK